MNPEIIPMFLMGLIVFIEVLHFKERRDLYNRLMAKSLNEVSSYETEKVKAGKPPPPDNSHLVRL